jgi:hypothetical protein
MEDEELMSNTEQLLYIDDVTIRYIGRVEWGKGSIDASHVSKEDFTKHLEIVAQNCVIFVPDLRQRFGGCMDGRGNSETKAGTPVEPRPKVPGGPSMFAWYVASVGNFGIIRRTNDPLEQFYHVNKRLKEKGFHLGMHEECGMARGSKNVTENYIEEQDSITSLITARPRLYIEKNPNIQLEIRSGAESTYRNLSRVTNFTEENMHMIVQELDGEESIVKLQVDHDHENHGHEEDGLIFVDVENGIVGKDMAIEQTGRMTFLHSQNYARQIVAALAESPDEIKLGVIIADQAALAAVTTLGKRQHVGHIVDSLAA